MKDDEDMERKPRRGGMFAKAKSTSSLIAAGEALRKAAEGAEGELYAIGWNDGRDSVSSKAEFADCTDAVAILLRRQVKRAIAAWNKAKRAAGASGKGK